MKAYKVWSHLSVWLSFPVLLFSLAGFATESWADGLYNAREELEYGRHAIMARQDEKLRQKLFIQYQQQQYLQQQRLFERQYLYNQTHIKSAQDQSTQHWGTGMVR